MQRILSLIAVGLLAIGLAACGSGSNNNASTSSSSSADITITSAFTFTTKPVKADATVTVKNDSGGTTHTVTANNGAFDTGSINSGSTATFTAPTKPGSYKFHCNIHPTMTGTLTVTA